MKKTDKLNPFKHEGQVIAILLAMGWHFNSVDSGIWLVDLLLIPGRTIGWAGVDIFFVLSGFLIGGLILKEYQITGGVHFCRILE